MENTDQKRTPFMLRKVMKSSEFTLLNLLQPNKPLVPTRTGEAPLLAAQRRRWAGNMGGGEVA